MTLSDIYVMFPEKKSCGHPCWRLCDIYYIIHLYHASTMDAFIEERVQSHAKDRKIFNFLDWKKKKNYTNWIFSQSEKKIKIKIIYKFIFSTFPSVSSWSFWFRQGAKCKIKDKKINSFLQIATHWTFLSSLLVHFDSSIFLYVGATMNVFVTNHIHTFATSCATARFIMLLCLNVEKHETKEKILRDMGNAVYVCSGEDENNVPIVTLRQFRCQCCPSSLMYI